MSTYLGYLSNSQLYRSISNVKELSRPPSFTNVYLTHRHAIYSYVLYRVGHDSDATEDIVSDIFLKAYKNFDRYDTQYAITTWLYTIARNTLIDFYRKGKITLSVDELELVDETDPLFRLCTEAISSKEVERAVAELPEPQQTCVREKFWGGKTAKEVAAELQISHAATRQHVSRGVAALRVKLLVVCLLISCTTF